MMDYQQLMSRREDVGKNDVNARILYVSELERLLSRSYSAPMRSSIDTIGFSTQGGHYYRKLSGTSAPSMNRLKK